MKFLAPLIGLLVVSCATVKEGLTVKQYHLRENMFDENEDPMARGEVQRHLHGAISVKEREQKIGQYYHLIWSEAMTKGMPTQLEFEYLQAGSGSKIKRVVKDSVSTGMVDAYVTIAAEDYAKHGRVLAWRASVKRGGETIASKQSYMWR